MGGKGSGTKSPFAANKPSAVDPDSNARTIAFTMELYKLPEIDNGDTDAVAARIDEFFEICGRHQMRPMVGGLALTFKMDKSTLWRMVNDVRGSSRLGFTDSTKAMLKNALIFIDTNFEQLLMDARNPVPAIFYTKSNLGWREAPTETVVTHRSDSPRLSGKTPEQIAGEYKALAGAVEAEEPEIEYPAE